MSDRLLRPSEVCERVALGPTEIRRRVAAGTFPAPIDLGPFTKRWSFLEVQKWLRERKAERKGRAPLPPSPFQPNREIREGEVTK